MRDLVKIIFRHEREGGGHWYSAAFGHKNRESGEFEAVYLPMQFPQGTDIPDRAKVCITEMSIDFYKKKDGTDQIVIKVWNFAPAQVQYPQNYVQQQFMPQGGGYQQNYQQGYQQGYQQSYQSQGYQQQRPQPQAQPQPQPQQQTQQPVMDFEEIDESVPF